MAASTDTCNQVDFNYELVKIAYIERVNIVFGNIRSSMMWNREKEKMFIRKIIQSDSPVCHPLLSVAAKTTNIQNTSVVIAKDDGINLLTFVNSNIQILPYEDCFDIFVDLHLRTSHAGFDDMYKILQNYFFFSRVFLECFVLSCNVCWQQKKNVRVQSPSTSSDEVKTNKHNLMVDVILLDMRFINPNTNNEFKYILVYRQEESGYILLRPLKELDALEVALELYNIFVDFGPPETINTTHLEFFKGVLELLQLTPLRYNCAVHEYHFAGDTLRHEVSNYMNKWMMKSNSSNWVAACYIVQFSMNTDGEKPMDKLFGRRAGQSAQLNLTREQTHVANTLPLSSVGNNSRSDVSTVSLPIIMNKEKPIPVEEISSESDSEEVSVSDNKSKQSDGIVTKIDGPEKPKCKVCYRVIMFNVNTCTECRELIHMFCGLRVANNLNPFNEFRVVCNRCKPRVLQ